MSPTWETCCISLAASAWHFCCCRCDSCTLHSWHWLSFYLTATVLPFSLLVSVCVWTPLWPFIKSDKRWNLCVNVSCENHQAQQIYIYIFLDIKSLLLLLVLSLSNAFVLNLNVSGLMRSNLTYLCLQCWDWVNNGWWLAAVCAI